MRGLGIAVMALLFCASASGAAPLTPAQRTALAGGWRPNCQPATDADADVSFTLEFAVSGGVMSVDSLDETGGAHRLTTADLTGDTLKLTLDGADKWTFGWAKDGMLKSVKPTALYAAMAGKQFHRCTKPADRGAIHLDAKQTAAIAADMPGGPTLIDLRAKGGCAATEYQYLDFDLLGPLEFKLHRWNSLAYAEKLADGVKTGLKTDEITDFIVEKADAIPGGYRFSITELIPPEGARGDTTTITLKLNGKTATIPEWKRTYALCTAPK